MKWANCFGHGSSTAKLYIHWTTYIWVWQGFNSDNFGKYVRLKTGLINFPVNAVPISAVQKCISTLKKAFPNHEMSWSKLVLGSYSLRQASASGSKRIATWSEWRLKIEARIMALLDVVSMCHPRDKYTYSMAKQIMAFSKAENPSPSNSTVCNIKAFCFWSLTTKNQKYCSV